MLHFFALDQYDDLTLFILLTMIGIGGFVVGGLTDMIMGRRGFGPVGNGLLAVIGSFVGIYTQNRFLGQVGGADLAITAISTSAAATMMLLMLGLVKHWVSD